tara:strand:+ start:624 stop:1784 length:1161 start_codon:yes stop_codon:yes gene_type:complete
MKKKIVILGSTGSIGKSTLEIIKKDKKNFEVVLISGNNNYKEIVKQAKEFNAKNIQVNENYIKKVKNIIKKKTKVFSNKTNLKHILKGKVDYIMCAISGLAGLKLTLDSIKFSKKIGIANKESIICGWSLINKELKKHKTQFIPIDSEHFSIWELTQKHKNHEIDQIILTASGGPFLNKKISDLKKVKSKDAIKHPNWKMGKKISVNSATLMNKFFEILEAYRMFDFDLNKYNILIHPQSYVHAIVKFKNGLTKILLHDTDMKIPISNSIYDFQVKNIKTKKISNKILNQLSFLKVDKKRFPSITLIKKISKKNSLYDTVLTSANEVLVELFLKNKISYNQILLYLNKVLNLKEFKKYIAKKPLSMREIYKIDKMVRLKTRNISVI